MQIEELLNKLNKKKKTENQLELLGWHITLIDKQIASCWLWKIYIYKKNQLIKHFLFGCFKMDEEKNYSSIHASMTAIATQVDW